MIYPNPTLSREHRKGYGSSVEVLHRSLLWQNNGSYKPPSPDEAQYFESNEDWVAGKRERRQNSCQPVAAPLRRILKPIVEEMIAVTWLVFSLPCQVVPKNKSNYTESALEWKLIGVVDLPNSRLSDMSKAHDGRRGPLGNSGGIHT